MMFFGFGREVCNGSMVLVEMFVESLVSGSSQSPVCSVRFIEIQQFPAKYFYLRKQLLSRIASCHHAASKHTKPLEGQCKEALRKNPPAIFKRNTILAKTQTLQRKVERMCCLFRKWTSPVPTSQVLYLPFPASPTKTFST